MRSFLIFMILSAFSIISSANQAVETVPIDAVNIKQKKKILIDKNLTCLGLQIKSDFRNILLQLNELKNLVNIKVMKSDQAVQCDRIFFENCDKNKGEVCLAINQQKFLHLGECTDFKYVYLYFDPKFLNDFKGNLQIQSSKQRCTVGQDNTTYKFYDFDLTTEIQQEYEQFANFTSEQAAKLRNYWDSWFNSTSSQSDIHYHLSNQHANIIQKFNKQQQQWIKCAEMNIQSCQSTNTSICSKDCQYFSCNTLENQKVVNKFEACVPSHIKLNKEYCYPHLEFMMADKKEKQFQFKHCGLEFNQESQESNIKGLLLGVIFFFGLFVLFITFGFLILRFKRNLSINRNNKSLEKLISKEKIQVENETLTEISTLNISLNQQESQVNYAPMKNSYSIH